MRISVETTEGFKEEVVCSVDNFPYEEIEKKFELCRKKGKLNISYFNVACAFDIETTTIGESKEDKPYGFMYHWQACISETVVFGRTWEEFQRFLNNLTDKLNLSEYKRLVFFVHNLSFEFQFIKDFISINSIFAREKRKPLYVLTDGGIEFRCSYYLSNMSLIKFCENSEGCVHYKLTDSYDYRKIRTHSTELTETELAYCYNDVRGLCECIQSLLKHDTIATLPLTNTGFVRRDFRRAMNTASCKEWFKECEMSPKIFKLAIDIFRGGDTHANYRLSGYIHMSVKSRDEASSYIYQLMVQKFPTGRFIEAVPATQEELDYLLDNKACLIDCVITNPVLKEDYPNSYIDIAHCKRFSKQVNDNGRILLADAVEYVCTEIDLKIIREVYHYDDIYIEKMYYSEKKILPREFREQTLEYYNKKTELKGIEEFEYEYLKSKNRLNSSFGMCVTSPIHDEIEYFNGEWVVQKGDFEESLKKFYSSKNSFLPYQVGVWCTAYAREHLFKGLKIVKNDAIYWDTDSIKYLNYEKYENAFKELNRELRDRALSADIPAVAYRDGKEYVMGVFEDEGIYDRFITLGSKKYAYEKDNEFHITVSGIPKKRGAEVVGSIENFQKIGNTYTDIGKMTSYFNDSAIHEITVNGDTFTTASNIGLCDCSYTMGVTDEYWELIGEHLELSSIKEIL